MFIHINEAQEGIFFRQFADYLIECNRMIVFNYFAYKTNGCMQFFDIWHIPKAKVIIF